MSEPLQVPELEGWVFIRDHPIARRVEAYEPGRLRLARYVAGNGVWPDGQLAVMRLFLGDLGPTAPMSERRKMWVIALRCFNYDTNQPIIGEPTSYILYLMERFDAWARGRDPKHVQNWAAKAREKRAKLESERFRNDVDRTAGQIVHAIRKKHGVKDNAFIPEKKAS